MKLVEFITLKDYNQRKTGVAHFELGFIRARDYVNEKDGHLLLLHVNIGKIRFAKKLFVRF